MALLNPEDYRSAFEAARTRYIGKYDEGELKAVPTADLRSLLRGT